jgi:hypothetical protein
MQPGDTLIGGIGPDPDEPPEPFNETPPVWRLAEQAPVGAVVLKFDREPAPGPMKCNVDLKRYTLSNVRAGVGTPPIFWVVDIDPPLAADLARGTAFFVSP